MRPVMWFLLGMFVMMAGQTLAQSWNQQPSAMDSYRQQTETNTLNNFNNYLQQQQMQQYQDRFSGKSPC